MSPRLIHTSFGLHSANSDLSRIRHLSDTSSSPATLVLSQIMHPSTSISFLFYEHVIRLSWILLDSLPLTLFFYYYLHSRNSTLDFDSLLIGTTLVSFPPSEFDLRMTTKTSSAMTWSTISMTSSYTTPDIH